MNSNEVRGLPVNRTTDEPRTPEEEELFKELIQAMREEGRRAKRVAEIRHEFKLKEDIQ